MIIEKLPEPVIELQKELATYHPTLCRVLQLVDDWPTRLEMIATHCNAKVDGFYSAKQIVMVIDRLLPLLRELRETQPNIIIQ